LTKYKAKSSFSIKFSKKPKMGWNFNPFKIDRDCLLIKPYFMNLILKECLVFYRWSKSEEFYFKIEWSDLKGKVNLLMIFDFWDFTSFSRFIRINLLQLKICEPKYWLSHQKEWNVACETNCCLLLEWIKLCKKKEIFVLIQIFFVGSTLMFDWGGSR
jgi:hypothetical protein